MAKLEHLLKLREGVKPWNSRRSAHPEVEIDLTNAYLTGKELDGVNFDGVNLAAAHLGDAHLRNTTLVKAKLTWASLGLTDLTEADLTDADLSHANLFVAKLTRAKLVRTDLTATVFRFTDLTGSDLTDAILGMTVFSGFGLGGVKGLETVKHRVPSTLGVDTMFGSKGNIPEAFLRGVGIPEDFVAFARSLSHAAPPFCSCFISYSSKDEDFSKKLYTELQRRNVRCWFAPEDLAIGDRFQERIEEAIRLHDKLLVVLSENSINSKWVEREVQAAFEKEQLQGSTVLFPLRLDDAVMNCSRAWASDIRRTRHIGDFCTWRDGDCFERSLDRLLRDLRSQDSDPKSRCLI